MIYGALREFDDIHTHIKAGPRSICSLSPKEAIELSRTDIEQPYSIMLHPWYINAELLAEFHEAIEICRQDSRFVAIGECGLDTNCETELSVQEEGFIAALTAAKNLHKPVIVHIVKAWDRLIQLIDQYGDKENSPIVIHGYRKNVQLAQQLVARGYFLSLGKKYNVEVPKIIPKDKLFHETDTTNDDF